MIPVSFNYKKASSVEEALNMLDADAQILGGGHSLIPALKLRLNAPGTLVDISKIDSIRNIADNEKSITIGGGVTHAAIASSATLAEHCPMMGSGCQGDWRYSGAQLWHHRWQYSPCGSRC